MIAATSVNFSLRSELTDLASEVLRLRSFELAALGSQRARLWIFPRRTREDFAILGAPQAPQSVVNWSGIKPDIHSTTTRRSTLVVFGSAAMAFASWPTGTVVTGPAAPEAAEEPLELEFISYPPSWTSLQSPRVATIPRKRG